MNGLSCQPKANARSTARRLAASAIPLAVMIVLIPTMALAQQQVFDSQPSTKAAVKMQFISAPWPDVLRKVADASGSDLVMDDVPPGRFSRFDRGQYTRSEAVKILNRELEPMGFRLLEKGNHLVLFNLRDLRQEYRRPQMQPQQDSGTAATGQRGASLTPRNFSTVTPRRGSQPIEDENVMPAGATLEAEEPESLPAFRSTRPRMTVPSNDPWNVSADRLPSAQAAGRPRANLMTESSEEETSPLAPRHPAPRGGSPAHRSTKPLAEPAVPTAEARVPLRQQPAINVARTIYESCRPLATLVDEDANGFPGVTVRQRAGAAGSRTTEDFTLGIDSDRNELVVTAAPARIRQVELLVETLDSLVPRKTEKVRFVPLSGETHRAASGIQSAINMILAQNERKARPVATLDAGEEEEVEQPQPRQPATEAEPAPPPPNRARQRTPTDLPGSEPPPPVQLNLLGPVQIREVPNVGLVVTGNKADVDAVMEMINSLKLASGGVVPDVHLQILKHVASDALAELLNSVYDEMSQVRSPLTGQQQKTVRTVAVVKPNAIIVVAPGRDMQSVIDLIELLDQPVDPSGEVEVFRLQHAVASQVVTSIDSFYATRPPLGTRVKAFADVRTNSVIIYARPNDLVEVARMIAKIDRATSSAVSRMRVFPLKNATATELAALINTAIQSVVRPPATTTGAPGQQGIGIQGAAGTGPQQLQDAKSAILEFLASDGDNQKLVRSGILADIRVTADAGRNTLIVAAPEQSMALLEALILQLDQPTPLVAEIKVFTLSNSDATATAELLRSLFTGQTQQQGQGGGFFGQQGGAIQGGLQLAGAEGAGAGLIPLRFSTDARTNTIIAIGPGDALQIVEAVLLRLDESDVRQRKTTVVKLKNTFANDVALSINQFLTAQRDLAQVDPNLVTSVELLEREIIVVPEIVSNSLLISATPRYYDEILGLVQKLDQKPPEVTIQALIVEVDLTNVDEFGVELGFQDRILFNRSVGGVPGFLFNNQQLGNATGTPGSGQVGTQGLSNFSLNRTNADQGFGGLVLSASSDSVSVLIRALASKRTVHVLSRPQIRTLDNQIAQILVGQQVPVATGVATTGLTAASPQVELRDVGILLNVIPRISPDGTIVMEVVANRSSLSATRIPIFTDINTGNTVDSPVINVTAAQATVSVPNGQTVVLGGMITKSDDAFERKVPWLGDIPVIGNAFRYEGVNTRRTELLIFLTPRVVRHESDSELIKRVESERLHFIERDAEEVHGPLYSAPPPDWYLNRPGNCGPALPPGIYQGPPPGAGPVGPGPAFDERSIPTTIMPSQPNGTVTPLQQGLRTDQSIVPQRVAPIFPGSLGRSSAAAPGAAYGDPSAAQLPQQGIPPRPPSPGFFNRQ